MLGHNPIGFHRIGKKAFGNIADYAAAVSFGVISFGYAGKFDDPRQVDGILRGKIAALVGVEPEDNIGSGRKAIGLIGG